MTESIDFLDNLARRLERRAIDLSGVHAHDDEDRAVRRSMMVIYMELANMIRAELKKQKPAST